MNKKKTLMGLMILFYLMAIPSVYVHWICDEEYSRPPEGINRPSYTMHRSEVTTADMEQEEALPIPPVICEIPIERPRQAGEQSAATTAARHTRPPNGVMMDGKI